MLYFCTINHGKFSLLSLALGEKPKCSNFPQILYRRRSQMSIASRKKQRHTTAFSELIVFFRIHYPHHEKRRNRLWIIMQIRALNAPCISAHIIAMRLTTALWTRSWWAPTKATPLWTSAPTVCPSARSKSLLLAAAIRCRFFVENCRVQDVEKCRKM